MSSLPPLPSSDSNLSPRHTSNALWTDEEIDILRYPYPSSLEPWWEQVMKGAEHRPSNRAPLTSTVETSARDNNVREAAMTRHDETTNVHAPAVPNAGELSEP